MADIADLNKTPVHKIKPHQKVEIDFTATEPLYTFDNIVLDSKLKDQIFNAISLVEFKEKIFTQWNFSKVLPKPNNLSINFYGESGTGKTMVANAVASHLNLKIIKVNYADIESKFVGDTSKNITKLFEEAVRQNAIILFDEADALLSKRVTSMMNATDVSVNQTRSVLLTLLDNFEGMVIFTTNFISNYDNAFMRRIPFHIKFELPNDKIRNDIFVHYLTDTIPHNINLEQVSKSCDGLSGSDIVNAIMISAIKTASNEQDELNQLTLEESIASILSSKLDNGFKGIN